MSLMQLLAVGKCLSNIRDKPSRYKMETQNLLPTFGLDEEKPAKIHSNQPKNGQLTFRENDSDFFNQATPTTNPEKKPMQATLTTLEQPQAESSQDRNVAAYPTGRWTVFKNPFHRKASAKSTEAPVQGELCLNAVKPVRNDLSENDLEIIEVHEGVEQSASDSLSNSESGSEHGGVIWGKISARLFGR